MDSSKPHRTSDAEFPCEREKVAGPDVDAFEAAFEAMAFSDENEEQPEQGDRRQRQNAQSALTPEEINAANEQIRRIKETSFAASADALSELAVSFFILAVEGARASGAELANALHDAFSPTLHGEKTAMIEAFDIAIKKEMLRFIMLRFIRDAHHAQAAEIIDSYIGERVSRRDRVRLGAANAELLLASSQGDLEYAATVQQEIDALKQRTHPSQVDMALALSVAGRARSVVDMLDQFEMMLRNGAGSVSMRDTELRHLSLLADHWDDFVQKYAQRTLKKC